MHSKLLIFDFDGTLADTFPWYLAQMEAAQRRFGFRQLASAELQELRALSAREIISRLGLPLWKVPRVAKFMKDAMSAATADIPLFPGVPDLLRSLHGAGHVLAIVSSNSEKNIRAILQPELAGLVRHFECGSTLFGKARLFRRVLQRTGFRPPEALCIGDELRDHEAARTAGIDFGAVTWGFTDSSALRAAKPQYVFETVDQIGAVDSGL